MLDAIGAALVPVREHQSLEAPLVLRLPLGGGGAAAAALWFDVVRRICRWSSTIPTGFWAVDNQALLLPVGHVPARTLGELWRPAPASQSPMQMQLDGQALGHVCDAADSMPWSMRSRSLFDAGQNPPRRRRRLQYGRVSRRARPIGAGSDQSSHLRDGFPDVRRMFCPPFPRPFPPDFGGRGSTVRLLSSPRNRREGPGKGGRPSADACDDAGEAATVGRVDEHAA